MAWLPDGEKISKISLFVLTQLTNVTDTQTDRQTPHDDMGRAYASYRAAIIIISHITAWELNNSNGNALHSTHYMYYMSTQDMKLYSAFGCQSINMT